MSVTGSRTNTFTNGDISEESFTSMQQTILDVLKAHDEVYLSNFVTGNTAAIGVLAGSRISVNYILYAINSTGTLDALLADNSVVAANSAPDGEYYVIFKPNVDGTCTGYIRAISNANVTADNVLGYWKESGTDNRIIGGVTKTGTVYSDKWRYQTKDFANELPAYNYRQYVDGIDTAARRVSGSYVEADRNTINITPLTTANNFYAEVAAFTVTFPQTVFINITAELSSTGVPTDLYDFRLMAQGVNNSWYLLHETVYSHHGERGAAARAFALNPGIYSLQIRNDVYDPEFSEFPVITAGTVKQSNVFGSRMGDY